MGLQLSLPGLDSPPPQTLKALLLLLSDTSKLYLYSLIKVSNNIEVYRINTEVFHRTYPIIDPPSKIIFSCAIFYPI